MINRGGKLVVATKLRYWLLALIFAIGSALAFIPNTGVATESAVSPSNISQLPAGWVGQAVKHADNSDKVNDIVKIGDTMYAAGVFNGWVWNGTTYPRKNVVAFSATTGEPTAFAPQVNGEILTLAPSTTGSLIYIGGKFTNVNGVARTNAAKINIATGEVAEWNPAPNSTVEDIALAKGRVVLAGSFTYAGGANRTRWVSVDQKYGTADNWLNIVLGGAKEGGSQKVVKFVPNPSGTHAVAIGNFYTADGQDHRRIVMVKLGDKKASVAAWNTSITSRECSAQFPTPEKDVAWTPNGANFVTVSTGGGHNNSICDTAAKWLFEPSNAKAKPAAINYTGGDTLSGVVCTNKSCFVSGHQRWLDNQPVRPLLLVPDCDPTNGSVSSGYAGYGCMGPNAVARPGIAEIEMSTWKATAWNPTRSREKALHNAMVITSEGLWVGSDGALAAGQPHNDMVLFPFIAK